MTARPEETRVAASWPLPVPGASVHTDALAVWGVDLDAPGSLARTDRGPWSEAERRQAARLRGEVLRRRYLAGRAALREILGLYLGCGPGAVALEAGENGRPQLARPPGARELDFNVSHADHVFLCALYPCGRVGVDVERVRPLPDLWEIAARVLPFRECQRIRRSHGPEALLAFFRAWTAREAVAKAVGRGLALPIETVRLSRGVDGVVATVDGDAQPGRRWRIVEFDPVPGFVGAVAVPAPGAPLELWRWEGAARRER